MKKRFIIKITIFLVIILSAYLIAGTAFLQITTVSKEKLRMFPIPRDFRNYFFLQSIDDRTSIVIGDFTGGEKLISLIIDEDSNGKINKVYDYYPESGTYKSSRRSQSQFFNKNIEQFKKDIIDGIMFRQNYSYKMKSLKELKFKIEDGTDIQKSKDGYKVSIFDPDASSSIMSEFYFAKKLGRYSLVFRTSYYKIFNYKIVPPLEYSVYCVNSKDKNIKDIVEKLLDLVK